MRPTIRHVPFAAGLLLAVAAVRDGRAQAPPDDVAPATFQEVGASTLDPAPQPRQALTAEQARDIETVRQLARHRGGHPAALAQLIQLSRQFDDATTAQLIEELAAAHIAAGNINLAAEARTLIADQYPADPASQRAILWLVRLYASSEIAHMQRGDSPGAHNLRRQLSPRLASSLDRTPDSIPGDGGLATASQAVDQLSLFALHLATQSMARHETLADSSALAFARAVAARRAGQTKSSQALLSPLRHRDKSDPWARCARAEAWLLESRQDAPPIATTPCPTAGERPQLDGELAEPYWSAAASPAAAEVEPNVRWAYDRQYLYVALQCSKRAGLDDADDQGPRQRDAEMQAADHVRLRIDVDRDYASYYELFVDSRGRSADRCCGDAAWNPQWYVAAGESADGRAWTIEAAIPLSELAASPPASGAAWAISAARFAPNATPPASAHNSDPTDFTLLLFE